jgi:hypothetical protein
VRANTKVERVHPTSSATQLVKLGPSKQSDLKHQVLCCSAVLEGTCAVRVAIQLAELSVDLIETAGEIREGARSEAASWWTQTLPHAMTQSLSMQTMGTASCSHQKTFPSLPQVSGHHPSHVCLLHRMAPTSRIPCISWPPACHISCTTSWPLSCRGWLFALTSGMRVSRHPNPTTQWQGNHTLVLGMATRPRAAASPRGGALGRGRLRRSAECC